MVPGAARLEALRSWHADWRGLRVAVLGLGPVGFSVADTLVELGADVEVVDVGTPSEPDAAESGELAELLAVIGARRRAFGADDAVAVVTASAPDVVVVADPDDPHSAVAADELAASFPVWSDLELAWRLRDKAGEPAEWLLVTEAGGAGAADAAATLAAAMLVADGRRAAPAGTAETPVLDAVRDPGGHAVLAVAVTPGALRWASIDPGSGLAPLASACLTVVGADEASVSALGRVYANTGVACVYDLAEVATRELVEEAEVREGCRAIGVGLGIPGPSDFGVVEGILVDRAFLDERRSSALELGTAEELESLGRPGAAAARVVLLAAALARAAGATPAAVLGGVRLLAG